MISVHFQGKPFTITVIQVYAPTNNAEKVEVEWFCENLQDPLELTVKIDVLFITRDWNAKIGSSQTRDGKSERRHSRNQQTKMDWNG